MSSYQRVQRQSSPVSIGYSVVSVTDIDSSLNAIYVRSSPAEEPKVLYLSQILSECGEPLTDINCLSGAYINIFNNAGEFEYFIGARHGYPYVVQTFEERSAIVEGYAFPEFALRLMDTQERLVIHKSLFKVDAEHSSYDFNMFINSVFKVRFVISGYAFSATLLDFRPPMPKIELTPPRASLSKSRDFSMPKVEQPQATKSLETWKAIGDSLCGYIQFVTERAPEAADLNYLKEFGSYLESLKEAEASKLSEKLKECVVKVEQRSQIKAQQSPSSRPIAQEASVFGSPHSSIKEPLPANPFQVSVSQRLSLGQPQIRNEGSPGSPVRKVLGTCNICRSLAPLQSFCSHQSCRSCITKSIFSLKCMACLNPLRDNRDTENYTIEFQEKCDGCGQIGLAIEYCTHKLCKACLIKTKGEAECFVCDQPQGIDSMNSVLRFASYACSLCRSVLPASEVFAFDCECIICRGCAISSSNSNSCPACRRLRSRADEDQLNTKL